MSSIERIDFEDCGYAFICVDEGGNILRWLFCHEVNTFSKCLKCKEEIENG